MQQVKLSIHEHRTGVVSLVAMSDTNIADTAQQQLLPVRMRAWM
jgi:hypothetical protein